MLSVLSNNSSPRGHWNKSRTVYDSAGCMVTTQAREGIETRTVSFHQEKGWCNNSSPRGHWNLILLIWLLRNLSNNSSPNKKSACPRQNPAKKYKLYKSSINKSLYFVQRSLSSGTRGQRVTAQFNLSREWKNRMTTVVISAILNPVSRVSTPH